MRSPPLRGRPSRTALALAQVIDDLISDARRPDTVHDQTDNAEAPAGGVPVCLDGKETVPEEGRPIALRSSRWTAPEKVRMDLRAGYDGKPGGSLAAC